MLDRLEASATEQRRLVSDAAHELRSPVATIRAGLELARAKSDNGTWPTMVDGLLDEESRVEALLDDLLLLAANDENGNASGAAPTKPVNLSELVATEARRPRRVPVELVHTPGDSQATVVAGDRSQLTRALSNLIDNGARHATSIVRITLDRDHHRVRLVVDNDGPGIPPEHRERVFERFTRLAGGTGLGLAVVRSMITRHHGQVRAEATPQGGGRSSPTSRLSRPRRGLGGTVKVVSGRLGHSNPAFTWLQGVCRTSRRALLAARARRVGRFVAGCGQGDVGSGADPDRVRPGT